MTSSTPKPQAASRGALIKVNAMLESTFNALHEKGQMSIPIKVKRPPKQLHSDTSTKIEPPSLYFVSFPGRDGEESRRFSKTQHLVSQ